jgi:hypothetical protein
LDADEEVVEAKEEDVDGDEFEGDRRGVVVELAELAGVEPLRSGDVGSTILRTAVQM